MAITESEVFDAFRQVYPQQADKACTTALTRHIQQNLEKLGYGMADLLEGLFAFQERDREGAYAPTWGKLQKHLPKRSTFDADKDAWDWIIERITMDGWREAMRQFFSECGGTGHGYEKDTLCRQRLIAAGINSKSMAYGPDGVFPAKIVEFWMILHGESNPAKAYEFLGNKRLADTYKAMPIERQRTYFNFTREERFPKVRIPDAAKKYMAAMKQRTEQVKG